jgi:hypothetical protein
MDILVIEPVQLTDGELAQALLLATIIRQTGALMVSEILVIDNLIGRIDSLLAARKFVRRLHNLTASLDVV